MFEMTSKSGGKVKIINVTEARANFATVLSDGASSYVITKNNKPQRVIINYQEYERLQGKVLGDAQTPTTEVANEIVENFSEPPLQAPKETREEAPVKRVVAKEKNGKESVVKGLLKERMEQAQIPTDYFGGDEEAYVQEDSLEILHEPESVDAQELERIKQNLLEESGDDDLELEDVSHNDLEEDSRERELEDSANETGFVQELKKRHHSPEEEAYFQKYRKLYEGKLSAEEAATVKDPIEASPVQRDERAQEQSPVASKEEALPAIKQNPTSRESLTEEILAKAPVFKDTQPDTASAEEDLPSLEDLLRDLNIDPLSDDSSSLDEKEINDLINRISND